MIGLAVWLLRCRRRFLERKITGLWDAKLSAELDQLIVAEEVLRG